MRRLSSIGGRLSSVLLTVALAWVLTVPRAAHCQMFRGYYSTGDIEVKPRTEKRRQIVRGYYPNGLLEFVASYRKGQLDGLIKEYYPNGMVRAEIPYEQGARDGIARFYSENGTIGFKLYYEDGRETGRAKFYDSNGHLISSIHLSRTPNPKRANSSAVGPDTTGGAAGDTLDIPETP